MWAPKAILTRSLVASLVWEATSSEGKGEKFWRTELTAREVGNAMPGGSVFESVFEGEKAGKGVSLWVRDGDRLLELLETPWCPFPLRHPTCAPFPTPSETELRLPERPQPTRKMEGRVADPLARP